MRPGTRLLKHPLVRQSALLGITFDGLLVLSPSEEMNDVFWVGHAVDKLLTEARGVEGLEAAAVIHLERERRRSELLRGCGTSFMSHVLSTRTLIRMRGFSGVSGQPSRSRSA